MSGVNPDSGQSPQAADQNIVGDQLDTQFRRLFDEVLTQTSSVTGDEPESVETHVETLLPVAKKYRGQPLDAEPILTDLVAAILQTVFGGATSALQSITRQVAATMYDDPVARERVERLWIQIQQHVEQ